LTHEIEDNIKEKIVIPETVDIIPRKMPEEGPETFLPYKAEPDGVSSMPPFGAGYKMHITGLTHDEKGYPDASNPETHSKLVKRLCNKILKHRDELNQVKELYTEDADVIVVSYGAPSRSAITAVKKARDEGIKAGHVKLEIVWPFPDKVIRSIAKYANHIIVAEMNLGQIVHEVERVAKCDSEVSLLPKIGGEMHRPDEILKEIESCK
jgi:2-oxoglutarate ferredoxin oxidoreductase subunit alpha